MRITIFNNEPLSVGYIPNLVDQDNISATFIVKAAYKLDTGSIVSDFSDEPELLCGTLPFESGEPGVFYETDFVPYKPNTDVLLTGTSVMPDVIENNEYPIGVRIGRLSKKLVVVGPRYWETSIGGNVSASSPTGPGNVSLNYGNSFGGIGYQKNVHGVGYVDEDSNIESSNASLPLLELADMRIRAPTDSIDAAGFGPLEVDNPIRSKKLGTFDDKWLRDAWPWFPEDLDWSFFNCAPYDQQMQGYAVGNETLDLFNLVNGSSKFRTRLPDHRIDLVLTEATSAGGTKSRAVIMHLDTIWIDVDDMKLIQTWRGIAKVDTPKLQEISDVLVVRQNVSAKERSVLEFESLLQNQKKVDEGDDADFDASMDAMNEENFGPGGMDSVMSTGASIGSDGEPVSGGEISDQERTKAIEFHKAHLAERDNASLIDEILISGGKPIARVSGPQTDDSETGKRISHAHEAAKKEIALLEAEFEGMEQSKTDNLNAESLSRISSQSKECQFVQIIDEIIDDIKFKAVDFTGSEFINCKFTSIIFDSCILDDVVFKDCVFINVDIESTSMKDGLLQACELINAQFNNVNLSDAELCDLDLSKTIFYGCHSTYADFSNSVFNQSGVRQCSFKNSSFDQCTLTNLCLNGSSLCNSSFSEVNAAGATFVESDLMGIKVEENSNFNNCDFTKAQLSDSQWDSSNLESSIMDFAVIDNARFESCNLNRVMINSASAVNVCFDYAGLDDACIKNTNLLRSSFEFAVLNRTKIQYSNLYESSFMFSKNNTLDVNNSYLENANLGGKHV